MGLCIIASRKHYSVDVVVAWYTVPLVFYAAHRRWTTKRPVQDYWPHRPLAGDEGLEMAGVLGASGQDSGDENGDGKPLLPVVVAPSHSRNSSRSMATENGKPPLLPALTAHARNSSHGRSTNDLTRVLKEPASPPPEGVDGNSDVASAVASSKPTRGPRPRQNSIVQNLQGLDQVVDIEAGEGAALLNPGNRGGGQDSQGGVQHMVTSGAGAGVGSSGCRLM